MSLRINLNTSAMFAHNQLQATDDSLSSSIEKLSSGNQINSAADNPSGLAISENLKAQMNGLGQAINNSNDAINVIKTADGALSQVDGLIQQIRTISVHAANVGANDNVSAQADQTQITEALSALQRIATQTSFGKKNLLDGSGAMTATNLDPTLIAGSNLASSGSLLTQGYASINATAGTVAAKTTSATYAGGVGSTVTAAGNLTINGSTVAVGVSDTVQTVINNINGIQGTTGVTASFAGGHLVLTQNNAGSSNIVAYTESASIFNGGATSVTAGTDASATVTQAGNPASPITFTGKGNVLSDTAGDTITLVAGQSGNVANALYVNGAALTFQVGAMSGQTATATIDSAQTSALGSASVGYLSGIDVTSSAGAQTAIKICDAALQQVSTQRASLGATQQGLQDTASSLGVAQQNIAASQSTIANTDMAAEMVNFTKEQILMQAGTSMLAQANQAPQAILSLLKG